MPDDAKQVAPNVIAVPGLDAKPPVQPTPSPRTPITAKTARAGLKGTP